MGRPASKFVFFVSIFKELLILYHGAEQLPLPGLYIILAYYRLRANVELLLIVYIFNCKYVCLVSGEKQNVEANIKSECSLTS